MSVGVKPNATTYLVLVDAHLINRDPKAALSTVDKMVILSGLCFKLHCLYIISDFWFGNPSLGQVIAGFVPTKDVLKKIRRRCTRQMDYESDDQVDSLARKFNIRMGTETRRDMLFNLDYSTAYAA